MNFLSAGNFHSDLNLSQPLKEKGGLLAVEFCGKVRNIVPVVDSSLNPLGLENQSYSPGTVESDWFIHTVFYNPFTLPVTHHTGVHFDKLMLKNTGLIRVEQIITVMFFSPPLFSQNENPI